LILKKIWIKHEQVEIEVVHH